MKTVCVSAGVIWRGGLFLLARRPAGKPLAGYWEFPGGKLEPGEAPLDALARELREELSISVRRASFWRTLEHGGSDFRVRILFFHVNEFTGEPGPREGQELLWADAAKARRLPLLPADFELLRDPALSGGSPPCRYPSGV